MFQLALVPACQLRFMSRPGMPATRQQFASRSNAAHQRLQPLASKPVLVSNRRMTVLAAHPHTSTATAKTTGFVNEMRRVAMKLHTKDQAPKEGGKEAAPQPMSAWQPTLESYLRFLTESKVVYDTVEEIIEQNDQYAVFRNTGLERGGPLAKDIAWFESEHGVKPATASGGPGSEYAHKLRELSVSDPPAFVCHYYNFYFAHTAGGRMIGNKVAAMILNNQQLSFYQWEGDVRELLDAVREKLNTLAEGWTREEKDRCLLETESSFKYSGQLLRLIFDTSS